MLMFLTQKRYHICVSILLKSSCSRTGAGIFCAFSDMEGHVESVSHDVPAHIHTFFSTHEWYQRETASATLPVAR
jgi:hypothetical protein